MPRRVLFALCAAACATSATQGGPPALREQIWTEASPTLAHDLTHGPGECLSPTADASQRQAIETGRALFRSPASLGGPAARTGLSCNACHTNGRVNAKFLLPELTNRAGAADVTSEWASKVRGDGVMNPRDIPDLAGVATRATHGQHDDPSLEHFTHSVMIEEFQGPEPPAQAFAGVIAYLRALDAHSCAGETPVTLAHAADDVRRSLAAAKGADTPTARLLLLATQDAVGRVVERLPTRSFAAERRALEQLARELGAVRNAQNETATALKAMAPGWGARFDALVTQLAPREAHTYFNENEVRRLIATPRS